MDHQPPRIIGLRTRYHGTEHAYLHGYEVEILAVMQADAEPDSERSYLTDDEAIAAVGAGVCSLLGE